MSSVTRDRSIRYTFLIYLSITIFLSAIILSALVALKERRMLEKSLVSKGESLGSYIALISQDPLVMKDFIQLDSMISEVTKNEDCLFVFISDIEGSIVTSLFSSINYKSSLLKRVLASIPKNIELNDIVNIIRQEESVLELSVPILSGDYTIGKVTICFSKENIHKQIVTTIIYIFILNILAGFFLGCILFFVSKKVVFTPLTHLVSATLQLAKGNMATRIDNNGSGEMKLVLEAFNRMAESLQTTTVSKEYVDRIIESMQDLLIVFNYDGTIRFANSFAISILKYSQAELLDASITTIIKRFYMSCLFDNTHFFLQGIGKHAIVSNQEFTLVSKNGDEISAIVSIVPMTGYDINMRGFICTAKDISALKSFELKLEKQAKLAHSGRLTSLGEMATGIAHEINQPLTIIDLAVQFLKRYFAGEADGAIVSQTLERIHQQTSRASTIIKNMRAFARHEDNEQQLVDLAKPLADALSFFQEQFRIYEIQLHVSIAEQLPLVRVSPQKFEQVVVNLLSNARYAVDKQAEIAVTEYTKEIVVDLSADRENKQIVLTIQDNGIGMDEEVRRRCQEPFYTTKEVGQGTGLGLNITYNIVNEFGGSIEIGSSKGKGSTFRVMVPEEKK